MHIRDTWVRAQAWRHPSLAAHVKASPLKLHCWVEWERPQEGFCLCCVYTQWVFPRQLVPSLCPSESIKKAVGAWCLRLEASRAGTFPCCLHCRQSTCVWLGVSLRSPQLPRGTRGGLSDHSGGDPAEKGAVGICRLSPGLPHLLQVQCSLPHFPVHTTASEQHPVPPLHVQTGRARLYELQGSVVLSSVTSIHFFSQLQRSRGSASDVFRHLTVRLFLLPFSQTPFLLAPRARCDLWTTYLHQVNSSLKCRRMRGDIMLSMV